MTSGRVTCRAGVDGALAARAIAEARREQREPHRSPPKGGVAGQITSAHEWRRPRCPGGWFTLLTDPHVTHHEKNQPSNQVGGGFRVTSSRLSRMFGEPIGRVGARFHASATLPHTHSRHARTPPTLPYQKRIERKKGRWFVAIVRMTCHLRTFFEEICHIFSFLVVMMLHLVPGRAQSGRQLV